MINHYTWLKIHLPAFFISLGVNHSFGLIGAHADKCCCYRREWFNAGIPFPHGAAIYLLTYLKPWSDEVRQPGDAWVSPLEWVIANYDRFKDKLAPCELEKPW